MQKKVLIDNIQGHERLFPPNALKMRMNWSKNVTKERDAPWQIVMGATDMLFCVLTNFVLRLEMHFRWNPNALLLPYLFSSTDDVSVPAGGTKSKEIASSQCIHKNFQNRRVCQRRCCSEGLGSQSIRKRPPTHARRSGCTRGDKDLRGQWKPKSRVLDIYDDTKQHQKVGFVNYVIIC